MKKTNKVDYRTHNAFPFNSEDKSLYGLSKLEYGALMIASSFKLIIDLEPENEAKYLKGIARVSRKLAAKVLEESNK